jgi:hypothetical protein
LLNIMHLFATAQLLDARLTAVAFHHAEAPNAKVQPPGHPEGRHVSGGAMAGPVGRNASVGPNSFDAPFSLSLFPFQGLLPGPNECS